jgi:uncharacterized protein (TIGR01777 family)
MEAMRVLIAGGSGLLGGALRRALANSGHDLRVLTRHPRGHGDIQWSADPGGPWTRELDAADAVVNLAGESIAGGRWTARRKQRILESRVGATRALAAAINARRRPVAFLSGSAVGYYGPTGDETSTEESPPGSDFLAAVCVAWEQAALQASAASRVVLLRTGVVLSRDGGALPQMALPFRFGVGGRVGSGRQFVSWIHVEDWVGLTRLLLEQTAAGAINVTAPNPVTNAELAHALGRAMGRPALIPAPAFALRLALGEMAEALLLGGQRVVPARAQQLGYAFKYSNVDAALGEIYG